jgi:sec-independent protein translocase protein TatC
MIWSGMVEVESLEGKRPYIIVGCFVVGMLLTPPDPFSQIIMAVPMWMLFEVGVYCGKIYMRKKHERELAEQSQQS